MTIQKKSLINSLSTTKKALVATSPASGFATAGTVNAGAMKLGAVKAGAMKLGAVKAGAMKLGAKR